MVEEAQRAQQEEGGGTGTSSETGDSRDRIPLWTGMFILQCSTPNLHVQALVR